MYLYHADYIWGHTNTFTILNTDFCLYLMAYISLYYLHDIQYTYLYYDNRDKDIITMVKGTKRYLLYHNYQDITSW